MRGGGAVEHGVHGGDSRRDPRPNVGVARALTGRGAAAVSAEQTLHVGDAAHVPVRDVDVLSHRINAEGDRRPTPAFITGR